MAGFFPSKAPSGAQLTSMPSFTNSQMTSRESFIDSQLASRESIIESQKASKESLKDPELGSKEQTPNNRDVAWETPFDRENPKDWSTPRKMLATFIVSSFVLLSPIASSMVAPALPEVASDLGMTSSVETALSLSIFLLAYSIGPLVAGPLSEIYGRVPVLQLSNAFFIIFNLACGFAQTGPQLIICRFFAGLGGAAPLSIGAGVVSDCWSAEQRGRAIAIYSLAPLAGPALGPIAGAWIAKCTTWRWVFWSSSLFSVGVQGLGLIFLRETYAPVLLERKAKRLRSETNDSSWRVPGDTTLPVLQKLRTSIARPFIMLTTQPIVIVIAIYMAYVYGTTYLVLSTFASLFTSPEYYNMPVGIAGLNYIALALGYIVGAEMTARINDGTYRYLKSKDPNGEGRPEFRAMAMIPCALLLPIGFFWYGWTAQTHQHWILPDIGAFIIGIGTVAGIQSMQAYIVDAYTRYAASGIAAALVLRSLTAFAFPLFAPTMYDSLGYGWGNTLLACVALAFGCPAPFLLWKFGARLRAASRFAAG